MGSIASCIDRRSDTRYTVTGRITAEIYDNTGDKLIFFPVDISAQGLGMVVHTKLSPGDELEVEASPGQSRLLLQVVWCREEPESSPAMYRIGTRAVAKDENLVRRLDNRELLFMELND